MNADEMIEQLQQADGEDRGKVLEALFPPEERTEFASAVVNAATTNATGVLARLNEVLARCRCQPAGVQ